MSSIHCIAIYSKVCRLSETNSKLWIDGRIWGLATQQRRYPHLFEMRTDAAWVGYGLMEMDILCSMDIPIMNSIL